MFYQIKRTALLGFTPLTDVSICANVLTPQPTVQSNTYGEHFTSYGQTKMGENSRIWNHVEKEHKESGFCSLHMLKMNTNKVCLFKFDI